MGDQYMRSCHLWQTSEKHVVDSMKWVNAPGEDSVISCTWNLFQESWEENCMAAQEEGEDLDPVLHQQDVAEVAVVTGVAGGRGQEVGRDTEGQGQETGEEDFETQLSFLCFWDCVRNKEARCKDLRKCK